MPSAFIPAGLGYSAMHLVMQQIHQWSVHPGPLVLRAAPLKYPPPAPDRDRTVSRRSEPSSRTALMGEQPNPWARSCEGDARIRRADHELESEDRSPHENKRLLLRCKTGNSFRRNGNVGRRLGWSLQPRLRKNRKPRYRRCS